TDRHRFRLLEPDCDQTKALGAIMRAREDLVCARVALGNQLRAELERFWPGPVGLFRAIDSPISLASWLAIRARWMPEGWAKGAWPRFEGGSLHQPQDSGAAAFARLRSAPAGRAGELDTRRRRSIVLRLTRTLQTMVEQISELESEIAQSLDQHPDDRPRAQRMR
ncbi:MAG: hypothetical protein JO342_18750, partial [Solirubrobacterales bacterium]|nr:hypothetical protein [Solirubrobacterales bacterium]